MGCSGLALHRSPRGRCVLIALLCAGVGAWTGGCHSHAAGSPGADGGGAGGNVSPGGMGGFQPTGGAAGTAPGDGPVGGTTTHDAAVNADTAPPRDAPSATDAAPPPAATPFPKTPPRYQAGSL